MLINLSFASLEYNCNDNTS